MRGGHMTLRTVVAPMTRRAQREVIGRIAAVRASIALAVVAFVGDESLTTQCPVLRSASAVLARVFGWVALRAFHAVVRAVVCDFFVRLAQCLAHQTAARRDATVTQVQTAGDGLGATGTQAAPARP